MRSNECPTSTVLEMCFKPTDYASSTTKWTPVVERIHIPYQTPQYEGDFP